MTAKEIKFLQKIKNVCRSQMKINGILSSTTAAMAIYESNWGTRDYVLDTNNLFRILVDDSWSGMCYSLDTKQLYDSKIDCTGSDTLIRVYDSYEQCIEDWIQYILNVRRSENGPLKYKNIVGITDYKKCINIFIRNGYIKDHLYNYNDPSYESTILSLIEKYELYKWDDVSDIDIASSKYYVKINKDKESIFIDTNKNNAISIAKNNRGYMVFNERNELVLNPWAIDESGPMYRVRLDWDHPNTQIDATKILIDARETAEKHPGYKVYEGDKGVMIYDPWKKKEIEKDDGSIKSKPVLIVRPGDAVKLDNTPVYKNTTSVNPFIFLTGMYYYFDDKIINGFARITKIKDAKVLNGKDPSKVIGFIKVV